MSYSDDIAWFADHPGTRYRLRPADGLEMQDLRDVGARNVHTAVVAVRQLEPGVRIRAVRQVRARLAGELPAAGGAAVYRGDHVAGMRYGRTLVCVDFDSKDRFAAMARENLIPMTPCVREFQGGMITCFYEPGPGWRASVAVLG